MRRNTKAFAKQLFGAKYESIRKSLVAAAILFLAVYGAGFHLSVAPRILYFTSAFFSAGVMWQTLAGRHQMETIRGMLALPFENRSFVFSYVLVLGAYTLITKTLLLWALFFAAAPWSGAEAAAALACGCMACAVTAACRGMCRKGRTVLAILWSAGILPVLLLARQTTAVLAAAAVSLFAAGLSLAFTDAYDFYDAKAKKKKIRHFSRTGSVFVYLARYMTSNKSYLVNTAGLCGIAWFLPLLFGELQGPDMFPLGLAILTLNTPVCTLLSADPDLEQALRALPGQAGRFCRRYGLFIFAVNLMPAMIYLCSWQLGRGGTGFGHVGAAVLFPLQSAVLSAALEWKHPIRGWKTESDLWHHPRKYLVPLIMLVIAAGIGICPWLH